MTDFSALGSNIFKSSMFRPILLLRSRIERILSVLWSLLFQQPLLVQYLSVGFLSKLRGMHARPSVVLFIH